MISPYIYEAEKIFIDFSIYWNEEEKYLSFYGYHKFISDSTYYCFW